MLTSINDIISMAVVVILVIIILIIAFRGNRKPPRHQIYNERKELYENSKIDNYLECLTCHHRNSMNDAYCEQCGTKIQ